MFRLITVGAALIAAYKYGEFKANVNSYEYLIRNLVSYTGNVEINEYVQITNQGIVFTQDVSLATPLLFDEAIKIKKMLVKYIPTANLTLETTNNSLAEQTVI